MVSLDRIKRWWKQYRCSHPFLECRYSTSEFVDNGLPMIAVERGCVKCGKFLYRGTGVDWSRIPKKAGG